MEDGLLMDALSSFEAESCDGEGVGAFLVLLLLRTFEEKERAFVEALPAFMPSQMFSASARDLHTLGATNPLAIAIGAEKFRDVHPFLATRVRANAKFILFIVFSEVLLFGLASITFLVPQISFLSSAVSLKLSYFVV